MEMRNKSIVIVAGGKGMRAGGELPKQFQLIAGKPMLMRTIEAFYDYSREMKIVVVLPEDYRELWSELLQSHNFTIAHEVVNGGDTRFHSVMNGLKLIDDGDIVGVHDAARPFVSHAVIERCYNDSALFECGVIPVIDEVNSVRIMKGYESEHFDRSLIKIVQTPQVFLAEQLKNAYASPFQERFTDDASVAEAAGVQVKLTDGDELNIKVTTSYDLKLAGFIYENRDKM